MEIRGFVKEEGVGGLLGWAKRQRVPLLGGLYYSKAAVTGYYNSGEICSILLRSRVFLLPAPSRALYMQPGLGDCTRVRLELSKSFLADQVSMYGLPSCTRIRA